MRTFIERWYGENVTYDIVFDDVHRRFEVCAGELVVFTAGEFVAVLHWFMRRESAFEVHTATPIDVSPPWEPEAES